eukprot:GFUD01024760.1.p1 GENE.GFUD01024760.1~~GFUD01024760.1.p1  ORF type:complete len:165 (-),score=42.34 GFUD01024760.1:183-677(-)
MSEPRRSGRNANKKMDTLTENDSGPNSPSLDFDELSIDDGTKKSKKSRALKTLKAKQDENSKFMTDFDPNQGRKAKLRISEKTYKAPTGKKANVYDSKGITIAHGLDLCDCLIQECPGCHFPCPRCRSTKCGHECRNNRKWVYDTVELDGMPNTLRENKFKGKA